MRSSLRHRREREDIHRNSFQFVSVPALPSLQEVEGATPFFEEDLIATQVIPGVEEVPSGEETTVETELATGPENQTEWGTEVFPTDISLLSGGSHFSLGGGSHQSEKMWDGDNREIS